jgi:hypothetical protein
MHEAARCERVHIIMLCGGTVQDIRDQETQPCNQLTCSRPSPSMQLAGMPASSAKHTSQTVLQSHISAAAMSGPPKGTTDVGEFSQPCIVFWLQGVRMHKHGPYLSAQPDMLAAATNSSTC